MENMIKVRAMRAAGIACFWCSRLSVDGFLPRQAVILLTLLLKQENGGRRCHLRDLYASSLSTSCRIHCLSFLEMGD